ncbi:hypothetical protein MZD54_17050, partial [Escherichia coli]|nr:hypothetical protein [Escherichia coli]
DRNRSHWSTSKTPSYTKSVSWQHHQFPDERINEHRQTQIMASACQKNRGFPDFLFRRKGNTFM